MSKGILIFAYNSTIDYIVIAELAARLAKKHLKLPVSLVTNVPELYIPSGVFDKIIQQDIDEKSSSVRTFKFANSEQENIKWHNRNRSSAYDLTPYTQTLLIDADYLIFEPSLANLFETNYDFCCYNNIKDITGRELLEKTESTVGEPGIPMQWATVVYFRKSEFAKSVFSMMAMIKKNFAYYSKAFNFPTSLFRNDYTLSIALQTMSGYNPHHFLQIPGKLFTANTNTDISDVRSNGELVFEISKPNGGFDITKIRNCNIHIMNKKVINDPEIIKKILRLV